MKISIERNQESDHLKVTLQKDNMEIEMTAISFNTGRSTEYQLEPDWFNGENAEKYFSDNWESIFELFEQELNKS